MCANNCCLPVFLPHKACHGLPASFGWTPTQVFMCNTRHRFLLFLLVSVPSKLCCHYLCQIGVFGLLLQKINKAHAKLHHKVSQLRLESLVELVGVSPHQLVHRLGHAFQTGLWSIGVAPGLFQDKPVDSFEVLPKLQPARLQSFGLLTRESVRPWQILWY